MKLEMMRKHVHAENIDRKEIMENPTSEPKRLRVCSPSSINRNIAENESFAALGQKKVDGSICIKMENEESNVSSSSCEGGSESREEKEFERFRNFWSGCNDIFEDDNIDIKEELNAINMEDLVEEEINKMRNVYA